MSDYFNGSMWNWFELTYSSYLVLPRTLLCGMPEEWQKKMVLLLEEMRETYDSSKIEDTYHVALRNSKGRFKHDHLANYKYPSDLPYRKETNQ